MTDPIKTAQERFAQGFSCSQSVFSAFASDLGIRDETALKLASPFGGGVAHQGQVCGAVTGALMVLGLQTGSAALEAKNDNYIVPEEFVKRFEERHGTLLCRDLIGYNISNPDELQEARDSCVFKTSCPGFVKDAAELVSELLNE
jgi:C_GCAxxG_C_C family probable redox protein